MRNLLMALLMAAPAVAAELETPPIGPSDSGTSVAFDAGQPRFTRDAGASTPSSITGKTTAHESESSAIGDEANPPTTRATALCDELRKAAGARASFKTKLDDERKALAVERTRLETLAADVARAREALKVETERLEGLLDARVDNKPTLSRPAEAKPTASGAPQAQNIANLAKALKAMKGPQAAALLSKLDGHLAAQVLQQMSPRDSGAVLSSLKPELAAELMATLAMLSPPDGKEKRR